MRGEDQRAEESWVSPAGEVLRGSTWCTGAFVSISNAAPVAVGVGVGGVGVVPSCTDTRTYSVGAPFTGTVTLWRFRGCQTKR